MNKRLGKIMALFSRMNFLSLRLTFQKQISDVSTLNYCGHKILPPLNLKSSLTFLRLQSSMGTGNNQTDPPVKLSQTERLKKAVRDYGSTIVVFHVAISLTSLGICYLAITNGIDAVALLQRIGFSDAIVQSNVAVGSSTFVMAYAVHKLFAPARIAITLSAAPFIVRYLRRVRVLKPPKL